MLRTAGLLPQLPRLRFITSFPRDFGDDILRVIAERPRICRYLHLPVQSGSDRMLKMMNRGYTVAQFEELIERVRHHLPDAELATDIICGFPTETEEDHQQTAALLRRCRFKNSFIFKYSPRPGTTAIDRFADDVSDVDKKRRNNELLAIQNEVSQAINDSYVGKTVSVFVESISSAERKSRDRATVSAGAGGGVELGWETRAQAAALVEPDAPPAASAAAQLTGRTGTDLIVCFDGDESLVGEIIDVKITRAMSLTLFGQRV